MPNVEEFGKKVSITLGALAFIGYGIYQGTTIYNKLDASISDHEVSEEKIWDEFIILESRMDKRYKRTTDELETLKTQLKKQDKEIISLEKAVLLLNEHIDCIHGN